MSNRNANKVNKDLETEGRRVGSEYDRYNEEQRGYGDAARGRSDSAYNAAMGGYQDFIGRAKGGGFGSSGPSSSRKYYDDFAKTGGLSDENISRIRGKGGFDEFARTGGYSEGDKTNIRSRALRTTPSFYENMRQELDRANRQQGGSNPTFDASTQAMARESSQATADATTDAELGIMSQVNEGRKWGIGGMSDAEVKLSDLLQRGKLAGAGGLAQEDATENDNRYRNGALELEALGGIRGLRTDTPGEVNMYEGYRANGMGAGAAGRSNILQQRAAYNPNRSFAERLSPYVNMAAGAAGTIFGGGVAGARPGAGGGGPALPGGFGQGPSQFWNRPPVIGPAPRLY